MCGFLLRENNNVSYNRVLYKNNDSLYHWSSKILYAVLLFIYFRPREDCDSSRPPSVVLAKGSLRSITYWIRVGVDLFLTNLILNSTNDWVSLLWKLLVIHIRCSVLVRHFNGRRLSFSVVQFILFLSFLVNYFELFLNLFRRVWLSVNVHSLCNILHS